jgi:multidrug transporter EmrE-like cation transporter
LSVAVVIWSCISLMFTIVLDIYFFKTKMDYRTAFFMGLCILSTLGLNYYSNRQ